MPRHYDADFVAWVEANQASLLRFGYLLTGQQASAQDLVQTALAKAYLKWERIEAEGSRSAYVRRIMTNEQVTLFRRPWSRKEVTSSPYLDLAADQLASADQASFDSHLWSVVKGLPPKQRAAVVLRYYEQLTEAETASILGCSVGTVKSQVHHALATLRTRLQEVPA